MNLQSPLSQVSVKSALNKTPGADAEIALHGWVRTRRDSKGISFVELNDGSCLKNIQLVFTYEQLYASDAAFNSKLEKVTTGASLYIEGTLRESLGKGQKVEIEVSRFEVPGSADPESYPLQKKRHTNEFLRTIAHLRPRTNTFGAVFRLRSTLSFAVHKFFTEEGFFNLHSPIITASDCEGAGKMFQVTTLPLESIPIDKEKKQVAYQEDFFGTPTYLTVSGQLEAELFALSLKNVYTFGPTFRAENSNTPRHLAEFWMIEPEMAFCDLLGNAHVAEKFLKFVIGYALEHAREDLEFFNAWVEKGILTSLESLVTKDFAIITYDEAISALEKSGKKFEFPHHWGTDIQTEHERYLTEEYIGGPVFVINYPKEIKSFYMRLNDDEKTVAAMDLLVPRLGEIIGGSQREERLDVLEHRIRECNLPEADYWWYLDTRRFGTVPHAGFGLGFERLVMYLSGISNIRDSIPFPRVPGNAEF
jgi:asparaginyl-tRNA synthetase